MTTEAFDISLQQSLQQFHGQILLLHAAHFFEEFIGQDSDIRFIQANRSQDIDDFIGRYGPRNELVELLIELGSGLFAAIDGNELDDACLNRLMKAYFDVDFFRGIRGRAK